MFKQLISFILFSILTAFLACSINAQPSYKNKLNDSLGIALIEAKHDTTKAIILMLQYNNTKSVNPKLAIKYLEQANVILLNSTSVLLKIKLLMATGHAYYYISDYKKSIACFIKLLKIQEQQNNQRGIASMHNNIGVIYLEANDTANALKHGLKSLKIKLKINDNDSDDVSQISMSYSSIGKTYFAMNNFKLALEYDFKALNIAIKLKNKKREALMYNNIGSVYATQKNYSEAANCFKKAYKIYQLLNDDENLALCLNNMAELHFCKNNYNQAIEKYNQALVIALNLEAVSDIQTCYVGLQKSYFEMHNYKKAYDYLQKYNTIKDSIYSEENSTQMNELLAGFDSEKKEQEITLLQNENKTAKTLRNVLIAGVLLFIGFVFLLLNRYNVKQKLNEQLAQKNALIEDTQKEINDSINYAKRIQASFMGSKHNLNNNLNDYFIYLKPRDVVSGDFYWSNSAINNKLFVCIGDSTGHGIPGAFMSLVNISLLNEAVYSKNISDTASILNFVRGIIKKGVLPDEQGQGGNDGMDCSLMCFNFEDNTLCYSCAYNPIWVVRTNNNVQELIILNADKMPVGRSFKDEVTFTQNKFQLQKNDSVYALTDGFQDQFGGQNGKKFMAKQLKEIIVSNAQLPMKEQEYILKMAFKNWKGNLEQVDDVCIMGIKI
jgi:serine phosphatase RsbU (regulator of sigma subunit)